MTYMENVVITSTRGDLGKEITSLYNCVIYLSAPLELRLFRIKNRERERFGVRVLSGGDMHEQQKKFYDFAASRTSDKIEEWLSTLSCKVIKLDGARPIEENTEYIITRL